MKTLQISLLIVLLLLSPKTFCQDTDSLQIPQKPDSANISNKKYVKYIDFRFENGLMLGDGSDLGDQLVNASYYNGLDLRLGFRKTNSNDVYSNIYRRPYLGVGWYSSTFHNDDIGNPHALYFFMTMPFAFEGNKKFTFSYSSAFGLSYKFNPYDEVNNPANIFIGSYRNCYVHLGFLANYKFSEKAALNATIGFKHFSNGSFKQPNLGINLIPFTLGFSYKVGQKEIDLFKKPVPKYLKHNLVNITFAAGSKNYEPGGDNYLKTVLGVNFLRQINYRYRLGVGMDFFYSAASDLRNTSDQSEASKAFSYAVVGSWEWVISKRLYVPIGLAFYLHRNEENNEVTPYYERVGIRYRFTDHICGGVTIKAHKGVADIFEWTVGYTFHSDKNTF